MAAPSPVPPKSQASPPPFSSLGCLHLACGLDPQVHPGDPAVLPQLYLCCCLKVSTSFGARTRKHSVLTRWEAIRTSRRRQWGHPSAAGGRQSPGSTFTRSGVSQAVTCSPARGRGLASEDKLSVDCMKLPVRTTELLKNAMFPNSLCSWVMSVVWEDHHLLPKRAQLLFLH